MPHVAIALLGPLRLTVNDREITDLYSDKVRALVAFLAVESDRPHRRETLAGLLWPGYAEHSAHRSLSQALFALRSAITAASESALADVLLTVSRTEVQLNRADVAVDATTLAGLLRACHAHAHGDNGCQACAERLLRALELYGDGFLPGFSLGDSPEFDEWLTIQQERHHRLALDAARALTAHRERLGEGEQALAAARHWVGLAPLDEEAQRGFIRLLASAGQRSAALAQYEACRRLLREELGIAPDQETLALVQRVRAGEVAPLAHRKPPAEAAPPHNLPAPVSSFVGREAEMQALHDLLADPVVRLVTIVGAAGMGKTRLALEAARAALPGYPEGVWLVELAPLPPGQDVAGVTRAVAAALDVREQRLPERPAAGLGEVLVRALQGRRLLLVLDNCEHVLDGAASLAALLLARCPDLGVLATSREPLRLLGEHLYEAPPLDCPPPEPASIGGPRRAAESLAAYSAVRLLVDRALAVRHVLAVEPLDLELAATVCRRLDGMPLAIELAAARLRSVSLAGLAQRLVGRGADPLSRDMDWGLLSHGARDAPSRQQALADTLAWSYDLLGGGERLLFDRLAVFAGSFDEQDAVAVCSGDGLASEEAPEMLAALVEHSLVQRVSGADGEPRYRLLETMRAYAWERLAACGEAERLAERHAEHYAALTDEMSPFMDTLGDWDPVMLAVLDAAADNLAAAIRWSLAHRRPEIALQIGGSTMNWTCVRTHYAQYVAWMREALALGDASPLNRTRVFHLISNWLRISEREDEAHELADAALEAARETGDPCWIGFGLLRAGGTAGLTGDRERARARFREMEPFVRRCARPALHAAAVAVGSRYEPAQRRKELMEQYLRQPAVGWRPFVLDTLGAVLLQLGELARAQDCYRRTGDIWRDLRGLEEQGSTACSEAEVRDLRGDAVEAVRCFDEGCRLLRRGGNEGQLLRGLRRAGHAAWRQRELDTAAAYLQEGLSLALQYGYAVEAALARVELAQVAVTRGDLDAADAICAAAARDLPEWDEYGHVILLSARGRIALARADTARAVNCYRAALEHARYEGFRHRIAEVTEQLAWALVADGQQDEGGSLLAEAERERLEMGMALAPVDLPYHAQALAAAGLG